MLQDSPRTVHLKDYQVPTYLIEQTDLEFQLGESDTLVRSSLALVRNPASSERPADLRLDGERLESLGLWIDGRALKAEEYAVDEQGLTLFAVPDAFVLTSRVRIDPAANTELEGLYRSGDIFCTQCEAEGFRKITWFLDRPDVMSRFSTRIIADPKLCPVLLSNGNEVGRETLEDGRLLVTWSDPFPKPAYLFALVAGKLECLVDTYTTLSGRQVELRIYTAARDIDKCDHAMESLRRAMAWDEEEYGREYDLDVFMIVAVGDFNMGAMENKGLNIFNSKFVLARRDTATDMDFQGIEGVIAHEYFHNWTGNRITCRDWFQLSLKEGLTVFRDQEFSADMGSRAVKRIEDVRLLRQHQFAEDSGPMAHPIRPASYIEINNFYTVTVYEKGAEVVRMQHRLLGPKLWRNAMDLYFERHDGHAVTTEDFVRCMANASGRDLSQFQHWYDQAGTPVVKVRDSFDAGTGRYRLTIAQSCPATPGQPVKPLFHIPFALGLLGSDGADLPLRLSGESEAVEGTRLLELTEREQSFVFEGLEARPIPSLLRGFSAPVRVEFDYFDRDLVFLMANDSDQFNRWDAAQTLMQRLLLRHVESGRLNLGEDFVEAVAQTLTDREADQALVAEMLELPSEAWLGDQMEVVDVDGICAARDWLLSELARRLRPILLDTYRQLADEGDYQIDPHSIARRSLRNLCLKWLMQEPDEEVSELCLAQYHARHNMTDVMAALSQITHSSLVEREAVLADFRERWHKDPLVLDKWFAVQAVSRRADTRQRVEALMADPAFSLANPNRVRALVGSFCNLNLRHFHAVDGSGYRMLGDLVLELDGRNPQIAARLLRGMARWRRFDAQRQLLMRDQFARILGAEQVSRDVFEVASKSVGGV